MLIPSLREGFIKTILVLCMLFLADATNYAQNFSSPEDMPWISFQWDSHEVGGRVVDKSAMLVDIEIEGLPYAFNAQFDLGAISSMLYENILHPYLALHPTIKESIDSTRMAVVQGARCPVITGLNIKLDNIDFPNRDLILFEDYELTLPADSVYTPTVKHVGTIAADLFNDKLLVIDYPNQRLCGVESLPTAWDNQVDYITLEYIKERNWVLLPFEINGKIEKVIFDTGSSLFPLVSSKEKIASIADINQCVDTFVGSSWGEPEEVFGFTPTVEIKLGETTLRSLPVYYSDNIEDDMIDAAGFWGLTGNQYFLDKVIIVDYKNKQFGILK